MDIVMDETIKPELTFEGFLELTNQDDWPEKLTSENLAELLDARSEYSSADIFLEQLRSSISTELSPLEELSDHLKVFEDRLHAYTELLYLTRGETDKSGQGPQSDADDQPGPQNTFVTQEVDMQATDNGPELAISDLVAFEQTTVECCVFPGFSVSTLTDLPGKLEPLQVLNAVTMAQSFLPGFKKFWKAIFLSEASVALLQDSFWWMFLDQYQSSEKDAKDRLFDRIADSFVAMTMSVHQELKDKVFMIFSDCLAQAIYVAFYWALPASRHRFDNKFKEHLATTTHEWVNGTGASAGSWFKWDVSLIGSNSTTGGVRLANTSAVAAIAHGAKPHELNINDVKQAIEELYPQYNDLDSQADLRVRSVSFDDQQLESELQKTRQTKDDIPKTDKTFKQMTKRTNQHNNVSSICGLVVISGPVAVGPNFERVLFNPKARSLLVLHFLRMHRVQTKEYGRQRVLRTQIIQPVPTENVSKDVVIIPQANPTKSFDQLSQSTEEEFLRVDKHQDDVTQRIQRLHNLLASSSDIF